MGITEALETRESAPIGGSDWYRSRVCRYNGLLKVDRGRPLMELDNLWVVAWCVGQPGTTLCSLALAEETCRWTKIEQVSTQFVFLLFSIDSRFCRSFGSIVWDLLCVGG